MSTNASEPTEWGFPKRDIPLEEKLATTPITVESIRMIVRDELKKQGLLK